MSRGVPLEVLDPRRLASVERFGIPDAAPVPASFGRLVDLAAELLRAPLGFFTVVDAETSWYAASTGVPEDVTSGSVEGSFCKYVIASGRPLFVDSAGTDPVTAGNPAIEAMGVRSWAGFPVTDPDGEVLGSFCVVDVVDRPWSEDDRRILSTLAGAATDEVARLLAVRANDAARITAERALAELAELREQQISLLALIQRSLLPTHIPPTAGLDVAVRYEPAHAISGMGGDWYDVIDLGDGRTGLVIADVSGHDVEAVAAMAQLQPALHAFARGGPSPSTVLLQVHELVVELGMSRFLSIWYGVWDHRQRTISYQSAGHPHPIAVRHDGSVNVCDDGHTGLLGIAAMPPSSSESTVTLTDGDTLVVFTDGLYERRHRSLDDGQSDLVQILRRAPLGSAGTTADRLMLEAQPSGGWDDDVALLVLRATS